MKRLLWAIIAILLVGAWPLKAEEVLVSVEIMVPPLQWLSVDPSVLDVPSVSATDLNRGHIDFSQPVRIGVRSNIDWQLVARLGSVSSAEHKNRAVFPKVMGWLAEQSTVFEIGKNWIVIANGLATEEEADLILNLRLPVGWTQTLPGESELRLDYQLLPADNAMVAQR
jgi:hypothetical protein